MKKVNKSTIVSIVTILSVFGALAVLMVLGAKQQSETPRRDADISNSGILAADTSSFNFGTISMAAGMVNKTFTIKNAGSEPLKITKIYTSCMCTTASLFKGGEKWGPFGMPGHGAIPRIDVPAEPGEEMLVNVVFDPAAHGPAGIGRTQRVVYLENTADAPLELWIEAMVTP